MEHPTSPCEGVLHRPGTNLRFIAYNPPANLSSRQYEAPQTKSISSSFQFTQSSIRNLFTSAQMTWEIYLRNFKKLKWGQVCGLTASVLGQRIPLPENVFNISSADFTSSSTNRNNNQYFWSLSSINAWWQYMPPIRFCTSINLTGGIYFPRALMEL